jgi:hypothetical protein
VLVRLPEIKVSELRPLLEEGWRTFAPKDADPAPVRKKAKKKTARRQTRA